MKYGQWLFLLASFLISSSASLPDTLVRKPTVCLMFMRRRRVRAEFDTFSDLQRQKLGSFMRIYRICLHKTAQLVTL